MKKYYNNFRGFLCCFLFFQLMLSQNINNLYTKSFEEVEKIFNTFDKSKKITFSKAYLQKATKEKNDTKIINGYYLCASLHSHSDISVQYLDSIIVLSKLKNYTNNLAKAYLQKGIQLYYLSNYSDALENYVLANNIYATQRDTFNLLKVSHYIGLLKNAANQEKEALTIFRQNLQFFENSSNKIDFEDQYFKSLFALADSYNRNKILDSAEIFNAIGIKESLKANNSLYPHFLLSYGATKILKNEANLAIDSLIKGAELIKNKKKALSGSYQYISEAYEDINDIPSSIIYLKKIDSIYQKEPQVIFHARDANQKLYEYFKKNQNSKEQLAAIDKLLSIDSIIKSEYGDLDKKIIEKYETPLLLSEKERLISKLEKEATIDRTSITALTIISIVLIILVIYFIGRNIVYKKRFDKLIETYEHKTPVTEDDIIKIASSNTANLPEKIVQDILLKLDKFEKSKKYASKKYTLHSLSKELHTNSSYLSKVINATKDTNFANYLNNLRIDFAIEKLKSDPLFRSYTIKAIAEEVGFNTTQSFSNAFYKKTGIYPSYFLKRLEKAA